MNAPSGFCSACGTPLPEGARFCPSCGTPITTPGPAAPDWREASAATPKGATGQVGAVSDELRPITALFADVVGSTLLGEKLTPAEVKALIGECVSRMSRAVEEYGGTIQAYMGDGICALFGVPVAREDDPERAVRASLRILEVIGEYGRDIAAAWDISDFNVRVGINSGQTAVGLVGSADPQLVALGDTTNVAARLQSIAQPGTVAVGDATAKSLAYRFDFEPLGDIAVKGREDSVAVWKLIGPSDPTTIATAAPLIGRDIEMSRLDALAKQLEAGRGGVLLLTGETGMGKTRLLGEFRSILPEDVVWLEGECVSYGSEVAYLPFVEMLRTWLNVEEGDAEVAIRTKLRARLSTLLGWRLPNLLPFLGRLLSVKLDPEAEQKIRALNRGALSEQIRRAYAAFVEALAFERPVVIAIDDLHWADSSTRELAADLLRLTDRAPVLVAAAFRPDPASEAWRFRVNVLADFSHRVMELPLRALDDGSAAKLVEAAAPSDTLDATIIRGIVARAEGNPLYIEELLRALAEGGTFDAERKWTMSVSAAAMIPAALENLLVARIDNLPPETRRVLQLAAVVGRTFPARVLETLSDAEGLEDALAVLLRSRMIKEVRRYPELEYEFTHGMLQDAALSTLTLESRRELYGRAGDAYEELFADSLDDRLEALAFYFYRSNDNAKALRYLELAGRRAASVDASSQARELFERALKVAVQEGDEAARDRVQAELASLDPSSGERPAP